MSNASGACSYVHCNNMVGDSMYPVSFASVNSSTPVTLWFCSGSCLEHQRILDIRAKGISLTEYMFGQSTVVEKGDMQKK